MKTAMAVEWVEGLTHTSNSSSGRDASALLFVNTALLAFCGARDVTCRPCMVTFSRQSSIDLNDHDQQLGLQDEARFGSAHAKEP